MRITGTARDRPRRAEADERIRRSEPRRRDQARGAPRRYGGRADRHRGPRGRPRSRRGGQGRLPRRGRRRWPRRLRGARDPTRLAAGSWRRRGR
ncbi:hypothetical protein ETU37_13865 [Nocardioides iriomotensis]|uniref:Uncharacterized protein n=1 Tax=Nocardioides iriomotensis TaxID=715784 RepID=A0A4Q5IZH7_9ACTN|nr:hypothetical protein ETU37_13865 [Nocardioides iriomotensis]